MVMTQILIEVMTAGLMDRLWMNRDMYYYQVKIMNYIIIN